MSMQIDLGCGKNKIRGCVGIDMDPESHAEIIVDFEKKPIPLPDSHVDKIFSKQVFEHLEDPVRVLKELHRITKPGGEIFIEVPHYSSHIAHGVGHKQYYSRKEIVQMFQTEITCEIIKAEITFHRSFRRVGIKALANRFPTDYERFWAGIFPAENIQITAKIIKP